MIVKIRTAGQSGLTYLNMNSKLIPIKDLTANTGQVEGLPANPRFIRDYNYRKLITSLEEDPEMLELREIIAYDTGSELIVIAGNMRLKASKEVGINELPTKVLPKDTPVDKLKRYLLKDNNPYGEWDKDLLANEWDAEELASWLDLPELKDADKVNENNEWDGMPEYDGRADNLKVIVNFETDQDRKAFELLIGFKIPEGRPSIWYPDKPPDDVNSIQIE
jgi:hypothetical protein